MLSRQFLNAPLVLLSASLLSACATAPPTQDPAALSATHGYAYVDLPTTGGARIVVKSVPEGKEFDFLRRCVDCNDYGTWLPEGDYVMAQWNEHKWATYPSFTVKRHQATNLGALVPVSLGEYDFSVLPVQTPEARQKFDKAVAAQSSHLDAGNRIEWTPNQLPSVFHVASPVTGLGLVADWLMMYERHVNKPPALKQIRASKSIDELLANVKQTMPPVSQGHAVLPDGSVIYGADMGQIRVRSTDRQWSAWDTGTLRTITAVAVAEEGVFAATEDGVILRGSVTGQGWALLKKLPRAESVVGLVKTKTHWVVMTAKLGILAPINPVKTTSAVTVYAAKQSDLSDLSELKHVDFSGPEVWAARAEAKGDAVYINVLPDLWRLDLPSMAWTRLNVPADVRQFQLAEQAKMIVAYKSMGIFSKLYTSQDSGGAWQEKETPPLGTTDIYFTKSDAAVAARWSPGAFSGNFEFLRYDAAANKWIRTDEVPAACRRLVWGPDLTEKRCVTNGNSIMRRDDQGWQVEYLVE